MNLEQIELRLAAIEQEAMAEGADLDALTKEANDLIAERNKIQANVEKRQALRGLVATGEKGKTMIPAAPTSTETEVEKRAKAFATSGRMSINNEEVRSVLISSGKLATPTEVKDDIHEIVGAKVSSIIDLVYVDNCTGMSTDRVPLDVADPDEAADQTEGSPATAKGGDYTYVDITPKSVAVIDQISKQAKKQTPINYSNKVKAKALLSLRKRASKICVEALKACEHNQVVYAELSSGKGKITEKTLRNIVLNYGGDEGVEGAAWLFLNKTDLMAFGDVRGTQDKKPVYEIIPDGENPNTGTIKEGGISVRYCLNKHLTAFEGTAATSGGDIPTMYYGQPKNLKLDLFSDYEIKVSEDFAFTSLLDTIRGDVELGAAVVAKNGFVAYSIKKTA